MKRFLALTLIILAFSISVSAQSVQDEFLGRWKLFPGVIEQEDGLLVSWDAAYSFPYLGITELDFLDSGFVVFSVLDAEYRAFYDISMLDYDNYHFTCTFKNGEVFILKLVRSETDGWRFLYRVAEDSILKGPSADEEAEVIMEEAETAAVEEEMVEEVEPLYSLYTGIMKRFD